MDVSMTVSCTNCGGDVKVAPPYTVIRCPTCGHEEKKNDNDKVRD